MYPRTLYLVKRPYASASDLEKAVAAQEVHSVVAPSYVADVGFQRQGYRPASDVIVAPKRKTYATE